MQTQDRRMCRKQLWELYFEVCLRVRCQQYASDHSTCTWTQSQEDLQVTDIAAENQRLLQVLAVCRFVRLRLQGMFVPLPPHCPQVLWDRSWNWPTGCSTCRVRGRIHLIVGFTIPSPVCSCTRSLTIHRDQPEPCGRSRDNTKGCLQRLLHVAGRQSSHIVLPELWVGCAKWRNQVILHTLGVDDTIRQDAIRCLAQDACWLKRLVIPSLLDYLKIEPF